ncbi:polyphosphate:AMP phosphotransferase [Methanosarcina sp. DH2]|uniref:polyphosphate:AMP phosphotransferase n=1 Tax=Methanosarcina sp. DH2 TaxID=2605639 RepID=UPI001E3F316C|nr:polyphosphate:AMP phosphotransferase [Methanosarcina sp. DH2]MCC4769250.1 polyphosphate:AMP phosphotransferase [Methanosarcina sp. DH2]
MLENVDLSQAITNEEYKKVMKALEVKLGELQRRAWELKIPIILVFEGWHASGMGEDINRFILPLDPRGFDFHTMTRPCYEDRLKPFLLRFWARTPVKGRIGIFDRSWYSRAIIELFGKEKDEKALEKILEEVTYFERQLADDGYLILKFFLHISEKEQKERFKEIKKRDIPLIIDEYEGKNGRELDFIDQYDEYLPVIEKILERTDVPYAPWTIVEANDRNYAVLKIMVTVTHAIETYIEKVTGIPGQQIIKYLDMATINLPVLNGSALEKTDLSKNISVEEYRESKKLYQHRLEALQYELFRQKRSVVIIFEGWDAAGKGGNIRRLVEELNPRLYRVVPVGSPNDTEKAHQYLWRFCDSVPMAGHITVFDRSWYGRVLVERVEGFCTEEEWRRAYREINEFEKILADAGTIILKFWLHIDRETQLERFESRLNEPEKRWKITEDDWRNRKRWDDYKVAADEMLQKTSTTGAPWIVIESRDKRFSRVKVLKTVVETIEKELSV